MASYRRKSYTSLPRRRTSVTETSDSEDSSDEDAPKPCTTPLSFKRKDHSIGGKARDRAIPKLKFKDPKMSARAHERSSPPIAGTNQARVVLNLNGRRDGNLPPACAPGRMSTTFKRSKGLPPPQHSPIKTPVYDRSELEASVSDSDDDSDSESDSDREHRSVTPCPRLSFQPSQSPQGIRPSGRRRKKWEFDDLSDSEVAQSEGEGGSDSDESTGVRKRRRRASPSTPGSEEVARESKFRKVDSPINASAFASLFRQPESSQSSQEPRKPRAQPLSNFGCVYVMHDDDTGHVKIGISRSAKTRRAALRRKCRKPNLTLEWHTGEDIPWEQLQRLEKIVHWDLAQFNRRSKCHCGVMHTEWFDVDIREAKRTVELWLRYQRTRLEVTTADLERLRSGFPKEEGHTWLGVRTTNHVKRYEYWHWKLFGEVYDEAFCEE